MGVQAYCVFWHQQLHANSVQTAQCPRTAFCSTQLPNNNQCRVPTMPACRTSCRPGQHALSCQHIQHVSAWHYASPRPLFPPGLTALAL